MARNRKRARDRRASRPQDASSLATAGDGLDSPPPLEHATPDSELADAQLALGRPDLSEAPDEDELEQFEEEDAHASNGGGSGDASGGGFGGGGGELALPGPAGVPEARARPVARLVNFLRGSWRELQRVQWPDRRQVFQATGVVIGFVIVAGVFLGLADFVATKLVNFILG